jgi:large conductance mechanosensitive channel
MKIVEEFREFAVRGNVIDMAVGVIIGTAFGKIVSSLVGDVVMPALGFVLSGINLTHLAWIAKEATADTPAVTIGYGKFLQALVDFVIIAWAVFIVVKVINRLREKKERQKASEAPAALSKQEMLLTEIRDLLKKKD